MKRTAMKKTVSQTITTLLAALITVLSTSVSISAQAATEMYFIHNDHLGTPQVVTDQSEAVVWRGRQKPFGETEEEVDTIDQHARFPGQYLDEETGLHYNYFRDYDPTIGRYTQSDPIGLAGGLNTYGYAYQNPVSNIDPDGRLVILGVLPFVSSGTASGLGFWGTGALLGGGVVVASIPGDTPTDKAEKARERKEYSRICKTPIPPTGDPCQDAKNNLQRLEQCLLLRRNFSKKWYNDNDAGHMEEIQNTMIAIQKLKDWIKENCNEQCE